MLVITDNGKASEVLYPQLLEVKSIGSCIGRTDAETEVPILWLPDGKSQLIGKDPDAGKD